MSTETHIPISTLLRVHVNESTMQVMEDEASTKHKTVEEVAADKLLRYGHVDSTKPILLDDLARQHIEKLLGRNLSSADELVSAVQRALQVRIDDVQIPITPYLLDRLHTRCIGMDFDKFISITITRLLQEFAGVR